jgi:hypothetical protein
MLENTIHWRRDFKPDMLDAESIRPEVKTKETKKNKTRIPV